MSFKQVLTDYSGPIKWNLLEGSADGKLYVEGKCGQAGSPTANGRIYGRKIMERELARLQPKIESGSLVGSLDHPGDGKSRLKDAAHIVRSLYMKEDGAIHGKYEIVEESDNGRNLAAFLRRGATIGMSSRGMGSVQNTPNGDVVGEDFKLTTFDFVAEPAVSDAYPVLVTESEEGVKPTSDDLRAKYPELVKEIEEGAYQVAQRVVEDINEDARESLMRQVSEETIEQYKEKIAGDVKAEAKAQMADEFSVKLTRALQSLREDIEKEVRADLASDPREAQATIKLAKIAEMIAPLTAPLDTQKALAELESVNKDKKGLEEKAKEYALTARNLAWQLYVERAVSGREDADIIREMVDVDAAKSGDDLKDRVEAAIERADGIRIESMRHASGELTEERERLKELQEQYQEFREQTSKRNHEISGTIKDLTEKITKREQKFEEREEELLSKLDEVESNNSVLSESLEEAKALAEELESINFASKRTQGHPRQGKVLSEVKRRKLRSQRDINDLAEEFEDRAVEPGGVHERVRRRMGRGSEHRPTDLTEAAPATGRANESSISDLDELGISLQEIQGYVKGFKR